MSKTGQEDQLNIWVIEPHEPLIFRDGRPFNLKPGVIAQSLPFPFPSTTTGGVRTQAGLNAEGIFVHTSAKQLEALKNLKVRGPLLVQLRPNADQHKKEDADKQKPQEDLIDWFVPPPADALLLKPTKSASEAKALLKRLVPIETTGILTDLANISQGEQKIELSLHLIGMHPHISGKPVAKPPRFWKWNTFKEWLLHPEEKEIATWDELGIMGLQQEERVHVSMDGENHKGKDGALFATRGMEFIARNDEEGLQNARTLALAVIVDKDAQPAPHPGFAALGGERRIVHWQNYASSALSCPSDLTKKIVVHEGSWSCRMILLTPAYFEKGFYPTKILEEQDGVTPIVKAIAIQRPDVISGWDFTAKNERGRMGAPKKTRRLAPAGAVLFLTLKGELAAIQRWVQRHWLECISDEPQDCNDGFGLAVIGTWNGKLQ